MAGQKVEQKAGNSAALSADILVEKWGSLKVARKVGNKVGEMAVMKADRKAVKLAV